MRAAKLTLALSVLSTVLFAQQEPCAFDSYTNNKSLLKAEQKIKKGIATWSSNEKGHDAISIIPIVVHVIHLGSTENISQAQIESQIEVLNQDYGKMAGSNGDGSGVDSHVRFCLAKIDPDGNCTNGIVRINSKLTDHNTYERALLKELSFWDNERYLNIYIVRSIAGNTLGYSSFPDGPADEDGMVMKHNVFGNTGTAGASKGRTATHEVGHWFGLYHTFNNGCGIDTCTDGDYVCDTPPQASPNYNCTNMNSCNNDVPNINDQKENYMNYTPDACKDMFTEGQKDRIRSTLENIRTVIWTDSNLVATGCDSNYTAPDECTVVADFVSLTPVVCQGSTIRFMDISLNNASSYSWEFEGGSPSSSTAQNPEITYGNLGDYAVTLIVSNGSTSDTLTVEDYVSVNTPGVGENLSFSEDFELGIFPNQNIVLNNSDGGVTWNLDSAAAHSGMYSVKIDNYINTNYGSADEIILPYLDLSSSAATPYLTFNWAYARSDASFSDELIVLLSTDCGSNYTQVFYKSGSGLATGPTQTTPFIPDSTQWKNASVSLSAYATEQYVQIKLVNITDGGNNLYIDNINVGELATSITENDKALEFSVYPNPAKNRLEIELNVSSENTVFTLINMLGKEVLKSEFMSNNQTIDLRDISTGVYIVRLEQNNAVSEKKVVVVK
jgi:PKD repeat protein